MLRGLEREIAAQLRGIEDDRLMLAIHGRAFRAGLRRQLGTPKALAAGFGAGLAAAVLFKRRPPAADTETAEAGTPARAPKARLGRLAGWALRDLVLPAAIALIAQAKAQEQPEPPEPPQFG